MTKKLAATSENLQAVVALLQQGEVVALPTETVYGLAGNSANPAAVVRIFEAKERPSFDPLIVHLASKYRTSNGVSLKSLAEATGLIDFNKIPIQLIGPIEALLTKFWPGPLTVVLPKTDRVLDLVTSGLPSVALRMPAHPLMQSVLQASGMFLSAPSANRFGSISPTSAEAVLAELHGRIPAVLDGGNCEHGLESTILGIMNPTTLTILRPGSLTQEEIQTTTGPRCKIEGPAETIASIPPQAAGQIDSHYAPRKGMLLLPESMKPAHLPLLEKHFADAKPFGFLLFQKPDPDLNKFLHHGGHSIFLLSTNSNLREAAQNFYQTLRSMDASRCRTLVAEPPPTQEGLGLALMDRLKRAAKKKGPKFP